jgi:hypothetical protein
MGTLLALASLGPAGSAAAQSPVDLDRAEELYKRGSDLVRAGRYEEACPILEKAQSIASGIGVALYLGECLEQSGHLVKAWTEFDKAERLAAAKGDPRKAIAHERAADLLPKLPKLQLVIPPVADIPGLVVAEEGATIERSEWGVARPIEPGTYRIGAEAPERAAWETSVVVPEGPGTVAVEVPTLKAQATATAASTGTVSLQSSLIHDDRAPTQRIAGVALAGLGAVGLVAGTIFGLQAKSKLDDSNSSGHCQQDRCDPAGLAERADAMTAATTSTVLFVGGFACLAGGIALYLTAPNDARNSIAIVPHAEWGGASLLLQRPW